jgi:hypothetical protein
VKALKDALEADYVVLGGGNSKKLKELPPGARLGSNDNAFRGGFLMWSETKRASSEKGGADTSRRMPSGTEKPPLL